MIGRGHGSAFLRLLASSFIREGAPLVAIDPDAGNQRARRAFARAGFAEDSVVEAKQGMVVLMVFGGDAPSRAIARFGRFTPLTKPRGHRSSRDRQRKGDHR